MQNLGCVRHLVQQDLIRKKNSLVKLLDKAYADAAVATSTSFEAKSGFHMMALTLPDGKPVAWADPRKMQGPSLSAKLEARKPSAAELPRPAERNPTPPAAGATSAAPGGSKRVDPRDNHYYYRPPYGPPRSNGPGPNSSVPPQRRAGRSGG